MPDNTWRPPVANAYREVGSPIAGTDPPSVPSTPRPLPLWQSLTAPEAAALAARDPVVILPLAAIEQHGPHLPLSTDLDIGLGLLSAAYNLLPPDFPTWVLPPLAIGSSAEHASFPGTLSLAPEQLLGTITALGESVHHCGVRRLLLSNSHGGNCAVMDLAALRLRRQLKMLVVKAHYFRLSLPAPLPFDADELRHGLHGGAVETALMLHLHPERVRHALIADFPSLGQQLPESWHRLGPEGDAAFGWLAEDLNPNGSVGAATQATAAHGALLSRHYAQALAEIIQETREFPVSRLGTAQQE